MADLKTLMLDEIRKIAQFQSTYLDETEELIDTGLPKDDDNLTAAAIAYLDDKGYRRRTDNLEIAKQKILEISEGYDTIILKKNRVDEKFIFEKANMEEIRDALNLCMVETVYDINVKLDRVVNKQFEYIVDYVDEVRMEFNRPKSTRLGQDEYKTFQEGLNEYAEQGWELDKVFNDPRSSRLYLVFKREIMS